MSEPSESTPADIVEEVVEEVVEQVVAEDNEGEDRLEIVETEPESVPEPVVEPVAEAEAETEPEAVTEQVAEQIDEQVPEPEDMELEDESESREIHESNEAAAKSKIQKDAFMEMFHKAPKVRDILPDLRAFLSHEDVTEADRKQVTELVDVKIRAEKAKKKAEKAREKETAVEKPPVNLANVIKSATGLDLAGILAKVAKAPASLANAPPITETLNLVPPQPEIIQQTVLPTVIAAAPLVNLGPTSVQTIGRGKAGFTTPHPQEIPPELRRSRTKPDMVLPIPDELRKINKSSEVPAIPNELLPPEQRKPEIGAAVSLIRQPIRKTLRLAGARPGKRSDRIGLEEKKLKEERERKEIEELAKKDPLGALNRSLPAGVPPIPEFPRGRGDRRRRDFRDRYPPRNVSGMNALPNGLHKNSPIAVKRYHARQLSKETGITLEAAMIEIEEQCAEFGTNDEVANRESDERAMDFIKRRGDSRWNERHNYTPVDHSKGIPGLDRPPGAGRSPEPRSDGESEFGGYQRGGGGIPGIDRPPGSGAFPAVPKRRDRKRGGVREREKRRRREELSRGGEYGGDQWGDQEPGSKYGRYDGHDQQYDEYSQSYQQEGEGGYSQREYDEYYAGQEGYENYNQDQQYEGNYDDYYQQHEGEQEQQTSSYYQEDGSQYYNDYYGTSETQEGGYQASFAKPAETAETGTPKQP